jgi:parallel beta-helix repeat protein
MTNTIIDGNDMGNVTEVKANNTQISGFTIRNHETLISPWNKGIYVNDSNGNKIYNNIIKFFHDGILLFYSDDNLISSNLFLSNYNTGIYFRFSNNTTFIENTVSSSVEFGLFLWYSSNNTIYHNDFIDNGFSPQGGIGAGSFNTILNNSYPFGGNYWSDYDGIDLNSTSNQDVPPSDSIGDTAYIIDANNKDNYPLMGPYNSVLLHSGWNLISIPYIQPDRNLDFVLSSINGSYDAVQWYNVSDSPDVWKHNQILKPSQLNDLNNIDHKMGFWIHINESNTFLFQYPGLQLTENYTIFLKQGWNLVGYPSKTNYNITDGLNNLTFGTQIDAIWTYNDVIQKWKELTSFDYFERGKGYWIHANNDVIWEVPL